MPEPLLVAIWPPAVKVTPPPRPQGSAGGNIGNDDKQLFGAREIRHGQPEESHRPAAHRKEEGRGRGNFDGRWSFVPTGCPGAGTIGALIRGGRFTTAINRGTVSPDGAFHATAGCPGTRTMIKLIRYLV